MSEFDDVLGDPVGARTVELGDALSPAYRKTQRLDQRDGRLRNGVRLQEVSQRIAEALRRGDAPLARELIDAGGRLFGGAALSSEVALRSRELELASLQAQQDRSPVNGHTSYPPADPLFVDEDLPE